MWKVRWLVIVLLVTASACSEDDRTPWQGHAAEDARELLLLDDVEIRYFTREEWSERAAASAESISDETLQYYADTYGRMGYFDLELDLRPVFAGSSSDWVGATYSPGSNVISLIGDARDDTIVHEFVHALQDDHFGIGQYDLPTSDGFMARRSVVEGDATLAQYRFLATRDLQADLDAIDWADAFESRRNFSAETLSDSEYPVLFLDYVSLVYTYGFEYMTHNLLGVSYDEPLQVQAAPHDWGRADQMYVDRAPETTEQILRLDLLDGSVEPDPVIEVGLRAVPAALADRLESVDWDKLGRWYTYLLLYPLEKAGLVDAGALSTAWDGDTVLFVHDSQTNQPGVVWVTEWDDDTSAQAIVDALWLLHGYTPIDGEPTHVGLTDTGERAWIERRDNRIVMAVNIAGDLASDLVALAFAGNNTMVQRRYPSLPETIELAHRSVGQRRCAVPPYRVRQFIRSFDIPQKK